MAALNLNSAVGEIAIKMTIKSLVFIFFWMLAMTCFAQNTPLSPRTANYDMDLTLDPVEKRVSCVEVLTWNNPSTDTIYELQFHIYQNAFKNTNSTFMQERGFFSDILADAAENCGWSWVNIQSISDEHGNDLKTGMQYIQPDDNNEADETVLSVPLPNPVLPKGSIKVNLNWESIVPKTMPRNGQNMDYFFMAQWFPKVGVYEPAGTRYAKKGQWNCHQYHSKGEYYADFGNYNVSITAPSNYVIGASGVLVDEKEVNGMKTSSFAVEDVIDYTWTASPHFVDIREEWKDVTIRVLLYPDHEHLATRYINSIKYSLEYFEKYLGKYPYPIITIVDPPIHGIFSAGMEYPTLITGLSSCVLPKGIRTVETLAIHEFTHQYFMQMIATHEVEEPFLDEGFTTYFEGRILDHYYGGNSSTIDVLRIKVGNIELNRADYFKMANPQIAENARKSWQFKDGGYGEISYNKTAVWLRTLEGIVGIETMNKIMKTYFQKWKFKHPSARDFIDVATEVVRADHGDAFGENLDWFFDQVIYGTELCDYKLASIDHSPSYNQAGRLNGEACVKPDSIVNSQLTISKVTIHRLGGMTLPVDVMVHFEDGETVMEKWDGRARSHSFTYSRSSKVDFAEIDPERKIYIDKNFINNSLTTKVQEKGIRKYLVQFMSWMQNAMLGLSFFC